MGESCISCSPVNPVFSHRFEMASHGSSPPIQRLPAKRFSSGFKDLFLTDRGITHEPSAGRMNPLQGSRLRLTQCCIVVAGIRSERCFCTCRTLTDRSCASPQLAIHFHHTKVTQRSGNKPRSRQIRSQHRIRRTQRQLLRLRDHAHRRGVKQVGMAARAGNGARDHDGTAAFADFVLLRMGGDLLGLLQT
jgi:hypothetical protein